MLFHGGKVTQAVLFNLRKTQRVRESFVSHLTMEEVEMVARDVAIP